MSAPRQWDGQEAGVPEENGAALPVIKGIRWNKAIATLADLEIALNAAVHVNKHLNQEIETLVQQLQRAEQERLAWEQHARRLAGQLAQHKRSAARADQQQGNGAVDQQQQDEQERQLAEQLAQLPSSEVQHDKQQGNAQQDQQQDQPLQHDASEAADSPRSLPWQSLQNEIGQLVQNGKAAGWLAHPTEVQLGDTLGRGAFGITYKAHWRGAQVAVKCVQVGCQTELLNFLREVECLAALRHPNVVPFLGAVLQDQGTCWLISEFMSGGTLATWLHAGKGPLGPSRTLLQRATKGLEVCRALAALESGQPPLLHRDVKPSNVFIDAAGTARLGDFGLARPLPTSRAELTGETGTYLYMSPEMMRHEVYDSKTDVWSFGVMLAELLTAQIPYQHTFMTPVQIAMGVAEEKLRPALPSNLPADLVVLAAACCDFDPDMRPSFSMLVPELEAAVQQLQDNAAAASNSLFGRLMANAFVPSTWANGVLGPATSASTTS